MNLLLIPTLAIASVLFGVAVWLARRTARGLHFYMLCFGGMAIAIPGALFAAYYLRVFGEPIWLYQFRSLPCSEVTASGAGFLAGLLQGRLSQNGTFRRIAGVWFFPGILVIGLLVPYLKPILRPVRSIDFQNRWSDDVCLQTSESSCGPACAATLLHLFGKEATEQLIAKQTFTSRGGTENWYIARELRRWGVSVRFVFERDSKAWPFPAIAGVRLRDAENAGHFITVLDYVEHKYVIGDPLEGKLTKSRSELDDTYEFTGFFMAVQRNSDP